MNLLQRIAALVAADSEREKHLGLSFSAVSPVTGSGTDQPLFRPSQQAD